MFCSKCGQIISQQTIENKKCDHCGKEIVLEFVTPEASYKDISTDSSEIYSPVHSEVMGIDVHNSVTQKILYDKKSTEMINEIKQKEANDLNSKNLKDKAPNPVLHRSNPKISYGKVGEIKSKNIYKSISICLCFILFISLTINVLLFNKHDDDLNTSENATDGLNPFPEKIDTRKPASETLEILISDQKQSEVDLSNINASNTNNKQIDSGPHLDNQSSSADDIKGSAKPSEKDKISKDSDSAKNGSDKDGTVSSGTSDKKTRDETKVDNSIEKSHSATEADKNSNKLSSFDLPEEIKAKEVSLSGNTESAKGNEKNSAANNENLKDKEISDEENIKDNGNSDKSKSDNNVNSRDNPQKN